MKRENKSILRHLYDRMTKSTLHPAKRLRSLKIVPGASLTKFMATRWVHANAFHPRLPPRINSTRSAFPPPRSAVREPHKTMGLPKLQVRGAWGTTSKGSEVGKKLPGPTWKFWVRTARGAHDCLSSPWVALMGCHGVRTSALQAATLNIFTWLCSADWAGPLLSPTRSRQSPVLLRDTQMSYRDSIGL